LIRQISWTGGFLDGVTIPISSDLTTLIGGRGTGKSTVIESLRYALGLEPLGGDATKDHSAIVDKVLGPGAIIKVEVDTVSPSPRSFTIERMVPNPPVVRDESGTATQQQPVDIAGHVEIFGQHELAELAGDPALVADMLQRFAGNSGIVPEHEAVLVELAENRQQLAKSEDGRAALESELADVPRLEEQVKQYEATDVVKRLADLQRLKRDESVFTEASQRVVAARDALAELMDPQLEASLLAAYEGLEESPQKSKLQAAAAATAELATKLKKLTVDATSAIETADANIASAKSDWETSVKSQRLGHAEVLRKLQEEGLEPNKYLATANALADLKAKQPRLAALTDNLKQLQKIRVKLLGDLAVCEQKQAKALTEAVRVANEATDGVVVVKPIAAQERKPILDAIGRHISGQRGQITAAVGADNFSPRSLADAIRKGTAELAKIGITGAQANNLVAAGEPLARELEELSVGHAVEVLLDISDGGKPTLKRMDDLSKGQRATALLLLLLGASTAPLVIDQPEDDLDNRFVFDGVVKSLRKLKGERQVIASTHNANVPVLGDAELIVALEGDGQHGRPAPDGIGSLDDAPIRALAERILEGGPEAFNARQHLYGF
jgi:ABC-type cobalamin/Fe3+-siderophores transport system ATPase subunit